MYNICVEYFDPEPILRLLNLQLQRELQRQRCKFLQRQG
jgi:hypothetical protein